MPGTHRIEKGVGRRCDAAVVRHDQNVGTQIVGTENLQQSALLGGLDIAG